MKKLSRLCLPDLCLPRLCLLVVAVSVMSTAEAQGRKRRTGSSSPTAAANGKLKVFILAGQSNMEGHGYIKGKGKEEGMPGDLHYAAKTDFKYLKGKNGKWVERKDVLFYQKIGKKEIRCNLRVNLGSQARRGGPKIGPELTFGHVMGDYYKDQVLLIKCAWGGQPLGGSFRPPSSGNTGAKYTAVLEDTKGVLASLRKKFPSYRGRRYEIVGFFWHQGWNDGCNNAFAAEYEENMVNFVNDMRKDLKLPKLPFIIATSGMGGKGQKVVKPQIAAAKRLDNCYAVNTERFRDPKNKVGRQISHWFNRAESYCNIGSASAKAMIEAINGRTPGKAITGDVK